MREIESYLPLSMPVSMALKLLFVGFFVLLILISYLFADEFPFYAPPVFGGLSFFAGLFFLGLAIFSLFNINLYMLFLPLVIFSVPNVINHLFPSVFMAGGHGDNIPAFSLFTHIDIFLALGVARYGVFAVTSRFLVFLVGIGMCFLYVILVISSKYWVDGYLYGFYQLRYVFLTWLFVISVDPLKHVNSFFLGVVLAILFMLVESIFVTSLQSGLNHFISGNLGKNPLGHFSAAMFCFLFFYRPDGFSLITRILPLVVCFVLAVGSGTRLSIIAALLSIGMVYSISSKRIGRNFLCAIGGGAVVLVLILLSPQGRSIVEGVSLVSASGFNPEAIERTEESSSMITRLVLWEGTLAMIGANPVFGVGPGSWAFLKEDFGIPFEGLLDPHNDFLNFLVSYGIPLGVAFYILILVYPLFHARKLVADKSNTTQRAMYGFLLTILITGGTNATLWKHQIFAMTCLLSFILIFHRYDRGRV